jgi:hypothetical protein
MDYRPHPLPKRGTDHRFDSRDTSAPAAIVPLRRRAAFVGVLCAAIALVDAALVAADAKPKVRTCTNSELRRVSDAFILDCTKKPQGRVQCQSNGDPICCYYTPWGTKCTTNPASPGSGTIGPGDGTRPPRAGWPDLGPDRVDPPSRPPRSGDTGPGRVGPANDPRPPRMDPGPGRVGPSSNPTGGGPVVRSGGGGKR